jgi:hypothetical protein
MTAMHPDLERIHAYHDGALTPAERASVAAHLEACAPCRALLASIPRLAARVEEATDLEVPAGAWERILERRAAGERIIPPALVLAAPTAESDSVDAVDEVRPIDPPAATIAAVPAPPAAASSRAARRARERTTAWTPGLRRAAMLLLGLAGVASAAVTLPMLRDRLRSADERPAAPVANPPSADSAAPVVEAPPPVSGVAILPEDGVATVDVDAPDPALEIRVRLVDAPELEARAVGSAAAGATFHPRPGNLRVRNAGAGELELLLPRDASRVTVRVNGEPYLVKEGAQIRLLRPAAEPAGSEVVLRVQGP